MSGHCRRKALRRRLRKRYGDNCCWCAKPMLFGVAGFPPDNASIEHIIPKRDGGADEENNLMLSHLRCNHARNAEDQARIALAAGSRRAKTPQAVECEASQSGGAAVTPQPSSRSSA